MPAYVKKNGVGTHLVHSKEPVTTAQPPRIPSILVAEYVIHPRLHAEDDLAEDPEVVHVVAVDRHIARAPRHKMKPAHVFLKLNPHHHASFRFDTLG